MKSRTKKRLTTLVVVLAVGAGGVFALRSFRNTGRAVVASEQLDIGTELWKNGEYAQAIGPLNLYVSSGGRDPEAMFMFADARRKTPQENNRHLAQAITIANEVAAQQENQEYRDKAWDMLLDLYPQLGRIPELVRLTEEIQASDTTDSDLILRAGILRAEGLMQIARADDALEVAEDLVAGFPNDAKALGLLFGIMTYQEVPDEVLLERAFALTKREDPGAEILLIAAQTMLRVGGAESALADSTDDTDDRVDYIAEAASTLARVLDGLEDESSEVAEVAIGLCELVSSDMPELGDRADEFIESALDSDTNPELRSFAAQRRWKQGEATDALVGLVNATRTVSTARTVDLGLLLTTLREPDVPVDEGKETLEDDIRKELAARENDIDARTWLMIADAVQNFHNGRATAARKAFDEIEASREGLPREIALFLGARSMIEAGETAKAIEKLKILAPDPAWRRARYAIATAAMDSGDLRTAVGVLASDPAISRWPAGYALITLAIIRQAEFENSTRGQRQTALNFSEEYLTVHPGTARALVFRGRALAAAGRVDEAIKFAEDLLVTSLGTAAGEAAEFANQLQSIAPELAQSLRVNALAEGTSRVSLSLEEAQRLMSSGKHAEAAAVLRDAGAPANASEEAALAVGRTLLARARGEAGWLDTLRELPRRYPESPFPLLALLDTPEAWDDLDLIENTIGRLEDISGPQGLRWQVHDARLKLAGGDSDEVASSALIQIEEVLRSSPRNRQALIVAADAAQRLGDQAASARYLERAWEADPSRPDTYPPLIASLISAGRTTEAIDRGRRFAELRIESGSMIRSRAEILESLGLATLAAEDWEQLAQSGQTDDRIRYARSLVEMGQRDAALNELSSVHEPEELNADQRLAMAGVLAQAGEVDRAIGLAEAGNQRPDGDLEIGRLLLTANQGDRALPYLLDAARAQGTVERWMLALRAALSRGDDAGVIEVVQEARGVLPQDVSFQALHQGLIENETRAPWTPIAASTLAVTRTSDAPGSDALAKIVEDLLAGRADANTTMRELRRFTTQSATWYPAWLLLSQMQFDSNQVDAALSTARAATQALPGQERPIADATRLTLRSGRFGEAASFAQDWQAFRPADPFEADISRASALAGLGRSAEAVPLFERHRDRILAMPELMLRIASIVPVGQAETSRAWIDAATEILEGSLRGRSLLARAWNALGNRTGDAQDYRNSISIDTGDELADTYAAIGSSHRSLGNLNDAADAYQTAYQAGSRDPLLLNNLAYTMVLTNRDAYRAVQHAQEALEEASRQNLDGSIRKEMLDTLGLAQIAAGEADDAVVTFREAIDIDSFSPHLQVGLAEALMASGKTDEAMVVLDRLGVNSLSQELRDRIAELRNR